MPNTATGRPNTMKRLRHFSDQFLRTDALTTALSSDSEISSTDSTATISMSFTPPSR